MKILVNTKEKKYNVVIQEGILDSASDYFNFNRKILIITDDNIPISYINKIKNISKLSFVFCIKNGEISKNINNYQEIMKFLIEKEFTRKDAIVAIGGGVVGDLSAFVASTYMRGIDFLNIPTTLLSQVDSSIGGKTAIDFIGVKNIIGTFYQPSAVLIDTNTLNTLPDRQFYNGLVEAIKISATCDDKLFGFIENSDDIKKDIEKIIIKSVKLKKNVVEKDTKESGLRKILNFGHTIGHAIEESCEGKLLHGECVGLGMIYFSSIKVKKRIISILKKYNLPVEYNIKKDDVYKLILHDKKAASNYVDCIYVNTIGSCTIKKYSYEKIKNLLNK